MNIFNKKIKNKKSKVKSECKHTRLSTRDFRPSTSYGFTLVETLVAIAILMIAIAGPLTVAEKGLSASIYARDQLMASYLAQDAMESIKNIVDSNELDKANGGTTDWLYYNPYTLTSYCSKDTPCTINTINGGVSQNISPLNLSSSGYVQDGAFPATPFIRSFYIQTFDVNGGSNNAANVIVKVTWPGQVVGGGGVKLEDTMYDTALQ